MSAPELKPCPFCDAAGGSIRVQINSRHAWIVCHNCDAEGPVVRGGEADAIAAWNTRTEAGVVRELVEALHLADYALRGANMDMDYVQNKVGDALAKAGAA